MSDLAEAMYLHIKGDLPDRDAAERAEIRLRIAAFIDDMAHEAVRMEWARAILHVHIQMTRGKRPGGDR